MSFIIQSDDNIKHELEAGFGITFSYHSESSAYKDLPAYHVLTISATSTHEQICTLSRVLQNSFNFNGEDYVMDLRS